MPFFRSGLCYAFLYPKRKERSPAACFGKIQIKSGSNELEFAERFEKQRTDASTLNGQARLKQP